MRQWAQDHDKLDDRRFSAIFRILYAAGGIILSVLAWSLKTQYDAQAATIARLEQTQQTVVQSVDTAADRAAARAVQKSGGN